MNTDSLVEILSTNVDAVDSRKFVRRLGFIVLLGAVGAILLAISALGIRSDLATSNAIIFLSIKIAFAGAIAVAGASSLMLLARPGNSGKVNPALLATPFVAIILLAVGNLAGAPSAHWDAMIVGGGWLECLVSIPVIAIAPFALIVWGVRRFAATTDLGRTGAIIGLLSGGISAIGYALHCSDDSFPFVALWYGGTIAFCMLAGAMLGPRLLRW